MDWTKEPPKPDEISNDWSSAPPKPDEIEQPPKFGAADTAYNKVMQGLSSGFGDELEGAERAIIQSVAEALGARDDDKLSFGERYKIERDKRREELGQMSKDRPALSGVSELAGAVGTTFIPGVGGAGMARLAATGAAAGAGNSEAEDITGLAADTAIGAGAGAALGKGGEYAGKAIGKGAQVAGKKTREWAEKFAARAIGAERGTIKKLGEKEVMQAGAQALDNGVLSPLGNTEQKIVRNEALKQKAMDARKAAYGAIDDKSASTFNPLEVATKTEQKILAGKNMAHDDAKELAAALDPHLSNILSRGDKNITMAEAQKLVEALGKKAKFDQSRSTTQNEVAKSVYQTVREAINKSAGEGADSVGVKGLKETIENANKTFAKGKTTSKLLENRQAAERGNNFIGLTDVITGGSAIGYGGVTGDWQTAAGLVVAKKGLQKYGSQNAALALNKVSKSLLKDPKYSTLAKANPKAFQAAVQTIAGRTGVGEKLSQVAENEKPALKGETKWANDGFEKLKQHASPEDRERLEAMREQIMKDPKKKKKLISASESKPGSKQLEQIMREINSVEGEE